MHAQECYEMLVPYTVYYLLDPLIFLLSYSETGERKNLVLKLLMLAYSLGTLNSDVQMSAVVLSTSFPTTNMSPIYR